MPEKLIGKVTHYFDKAMVIVVKLEEPIAVGDTIKIKRGEEEFEQKIESMQIEHEQVEKGKKGDEIAIKVDQPTKEGAAVYKVE
jgi:putative protease